MRDPIALLESSALSYSDGIDDLICRLIGTKDLHKRGDKS